jgi:hypothetical protein
MMGKLDLAIAQHLDIVRLSDTLPASFPKPVAQLDFRHAAL